MHHDSVVERFRSRFSRLIGPRFAVALALLGLLGYALTRSANYSGDAIYYAAKVESIRSPAGLMLPGHLIYCLLSRAFYRGGASLGIFSSALEAMQWLSVLAGGASLGIMGALAYRLVRRRAVAVLATLGFGASYAYWIQATDAETYSLGIMCLLAAALLLQSGLTRVKEGRGSATLYFAGVGLLHALASLIHLSLLLFLPAALVGLLGRGRSRADSGLLRAATYVGVLTAICLLPITAAAFAVGGARSPAGVIAWLAESAHGLPGSLSLASAVRATYVLFNSFVFLGDLGQSVRTALAQGLPGGAAAFVRAHALPIANLLIVSVLLLVAAWAGIRRAASLRHTAEGNLSWLIAWILPFAALAAYYYYSETEGWVMILPPLWLLIGFIATAAPPQSTRRDTALLALAVAFLVAVNAAGGILPARDLRNNVKYATAQQIYNRVGRADLVITAGRVHESDGYLRYFFGHRDCVSLLSLWGTAQRTRRGLREVVGQCLAAAENRGAAAWLFGDISTPEVRSHPWSDFGKLGVKKPDVISALSAFECVKGTEIAPGQWLYRLRARPEGVTRVRGGEGPGSSKPRSP